MIASIRRVATTLFVLGLLVTGITIVSKVAVSCPLSENCLGSVFWTTNGNILPAGAVQNSTANVVLVESNSEFEYFLRLLESVGLYMLLFAAIAIFAIEIRELDFLKKLS